MADNLADMVVTGFGALQTQRIGIQPLAFFQHKGVGAQISFRANADQGRG